MRNCTIFSKNEINTGRQWESDWAKSFTIIFMVVIHIYSDLSTVDSVSSLPSDVFRTAIEFLGGPVCAPVFMFAMGAGMVYTRFTSPHEMANRGIKLIRNGYLLNLFRDSLPALVYVLIGIERKYMLIPYFLYVDIMIFAGLAFLNVAMMKKIGLKPLWILAVTIVFNVLGHYLSLIPIESEWAGYLTAPFILSNEYTAFPLLLWMYYPVAGIVFAGILQHVTNKDLFCRRLSAIGATGVIATVIIMHVAGIDFRTMFALADNLYYNQTLLHYAFTASLLFIVFSFYHALSRTVHNHAVITAVRFLSRNLNLIYIIHWLIIGNLDYFFVLPNIPYLSRQWIIPVAIGVLVVSIAISILYLNWKETRLIKTER